MPPRYIVISCACCSQLHHDTEIFNQGLFMSTARTCHGMGICDYNDGLTNLTYIQRAESDLVILNFSSMTLGIHIALWCRGCVVQPYMNFRTLHIPAWIQISAIQQFTLWRELKQQRYQSNALKHHSTVDYMLSTCWKKIVITSIWKELEFSSRFS